MKNHNLDLVLKNMTSNSCIKLIQYKLDALEDVKIIHLSLGYLIIESPLLKKEVSKIIEELGFEILKDEDEIIVEKAKIAAIELIHLATNSNSLIRNSKYISERVQENYEKISKTFSKVTGITIEKYIIILKIEKVKMMLLEEDYSLSEISYQLGYSSVQYLSRQFKSTTGYTVSAFKELENPPRLPLDKII